MQQRLKSASGIARTRIVAAELLDQLLGAAHHPVAALDARFGRETLSTLTGDLESNRLRGDAS
jgi:hypothetical protein